jgi:hypothetical protein
MKSGKYIQPSRCVPIVKNQSFNVIKLGFDLPEITR